MFDKKYEERLSVWKDFRLSLETSNDPIQETIEFYRFAPLVSISVDPYTPKTWPSPWELLAENQYCNFAKILGICYSLQLTDCLSQTSFVIHITLDVKNSTTYYLLFVDDRVVGFNGDGHVSEEELPKDLQIQLKHAMPKFK